MDASQASAVLSQTSMVSAEIDESAMTMTYYQVTSQQFPEALGERFNLILPSMGETPIPFSALKADGDRGARIVAFTVARVPPGSVLGKDYTLMTGDPDKVAAVGLFVIYPGQTGTPNLKLLAYGTRLDLRPAGEGFSPDPYLEFAMRDIATEAQTQFGPTALIRYARIQKTTSPEYLTTLGTLASIGFAVSSFTAKGGLALLKISDDREAAGTAYRSVDVSQLRMNTAAEAIERIVYEYLEKPSGETKTVTFPEILEVQSVDRRGAETSDTVEMIARVGTIVAPANGIITIPDAELRDAVPTAPRRGGRKTYRAKKKGRKTTSRRSS
jgi:hypothetical protein